MGRQKGTPTQRRLESSWGEASPTSTANGGILGTLGAILQPEQKAPSATTRRALVFSSSDSEEEDVSGVATKKSKPQPTAGETKTTGATFTEEDVAEAVEPPPEIEIISGGNHPTKGTSKLLPQEEEIMIRYSNNHNNPRSSTEEVANSHHSSGNHSSIVLYSYPIDAQRVRLQIVTADAPTGSDTPLEEDPIISIRTAQGARKLFQFCARPQTLSSAVTAAEQFNNISNSNSNYSDHKRQHTTAVEKEKDIGAKVQHPYANLGSAVEQGLLKMTLERTSPNDDGVTQSHLPEKERLEHDWQMTLSLTPQALEVCHPAVLPVRSHQRSKSSQSAACLRRALGELFPSEFFSGSGANHNSESHPMTAQEIYRLVDNRQYKKYLDRKKAGEPLEIPGLVPTLRPYQEAAVRWMLERENQGGDEHAKEWELAWVVILTGQQQQQQQQQQSSSKHKPRVVFLPDYMPHHPQRLQQDKMSDRFFYCPFTGWLALTMEDARTMTLLQSQQTPVGATINPYSFRGGIIAEQMGLGKTVEVLACILANQCTSVADEESAIHLVSSSDASSSSALSSRNSSLNSLPTMAQNDLSGNSAADEKSAIHLGPDLEECWIDHEERELGTCICSKTVSLFPSPKLDSIVICTNCREPMHSTCAAFGEEQGQLSSLSRGIVYRMRFSEETYACKLCPATFCPCCVADMASGNGHATKICSRATVIVTPPAILSQWEREIERHTTKGDGNIKVVTYAGVKNTLRDCSSSGGSHSISMLHPRRLADADIVLMTFDALRHDLSHSDANPFATGAGRASLRKRKRYRVVPSPLSSIFWWRVCLDEAQRIETPTAASAQMALKLFTQFRWAVSGTPISKGKLEDLYGLLLFLHVTTPFQQKDWFAKCFTRSANNPYLGKRLQHLLANTLWRSTKSLESVATQMGVPPQIEKKTILKVRNSNVVSFHLIAYFPAQVSRLFVFNLAVFKY